MEKQEFSVIFSISNQTFTIVRGAPPPPRIRQKYIDSMEKWQNRNFPISYQIITSVGGQSPRNPHIVLEYRKLPENGHFHWFFSSYPKLLPASGGLRPGPPLQIVFLIENFWGCPHCLKQNPAGAYDMYLYMYIVHVLIYVKWRVFYFDFIKFWNNSWILN